MNKAVIRQNREGRRMEERDRQFLEKMWAKAEAKEESRKLAESLVRREGDAAMPAKPLVRGEKGAIMPAEALARREEDAIMSAEALVRRREAARRAAPLESGRCPGMAVFFRDMFRGIGIRQIYGGMADVLCISAAVTGLLLYLLTQSVGGLGISADAAVFCGSPLLYGCIFLLFWMKDAQSDVYGLEMSCKYTFFHLLAARMFAASLLGMGCNGLYVLVLILRYRADGLRLAAVSFSALACFSLLLTAGLEKGKRFGWAAAVCGGWVTVNLTAFFRFPNGYGALLERIPAYLFLAGGAAGTALYLRQLLLMTTLKFRKEYSDAAN